MPPDPAATRRAQRATVGLAAALAVGMLGYRAVMGAGLDQTAALFVGLPAVLAITVAFTPPARTVTGLILKTMTLGMLLSGILLGETLVCILVAAPLVYLVGIAIGVPIDVSRRRGARGRPARGPLAVVGLVLIAGLEGVAPGFEFPAAGSVTVTRQVDAAPQAVAAALAATPRFEEPLPLRLRVGFPHPVAASGSGLRVGDRRQVIFVGDDHHGATHVGALQLQVVESEPGRVVFAVMEDDTRVAHWLRWSRAEVTWEAAGSGTQVSWTSEYERQLAPAFYFHPLQHQAARLATGYLIDVAATPHG